MRFGGHETFAIREGWLHKGLKLLIEEPDLLHDEFAADWLGVGRNMAKSIRHWLQATGLASLTKEGKNDKRGRLHPTDLGRALFEADPYFGELGTWWILHINLVNNPDHATSWNWFFNSFQNPRFEKPLCLEGLTRYLKMRKKTLPSPNTLNRDIGCLLASYSKVIPPRSDDPEDGLDSPFSELGLMHYFRTSGYYQLHQGPKQIDPSIMGYALAMAFEQVGQGKGQVEVSIHDAVRQPCSPAKVFVLTSESLFETLIAYEGKSESAKIEVRGLAGERMLRVTARKPLDWLDLYFEDLESRKADAA